MAMNNSIIDFLEKNDLGWDRVSVELSGTNFVATLADCLWYLDGSHHTLAGRSCDVLEMFVCVCVCACMHACMCVYRISPNICRTFLH